MKRNSLTKGLVVSVALSAMLTGCGDIENKINDLIEDVRLAYIEGNAVDGYLKDATVCLDLNSDGICQSTEPTAKTSKDGAYKLDISEDVQKNPDFYKAMILVYGGTDLDTGTVFKGKLLASHDGKKVHVTPMTTLVAKAIQKELKADKKLTQKELKTIRDEHKQRVADVFGLRVDDIDRDPVELKDANPKLIQESLKLQKTLEAINIDKDKDGIEEAYEKLAENLKDVKSEEGLEVLLQKSYKNHAHLEDAQNIGKNLDESFEKFKDDLDLGKIGLITKEDLKELKRGNHVKVGQENRYFKDAVDWEKELIKSELDDHDIDVTDEQLNALKDRFDGEIKPGSIKKDFEKFKDDDDEFMKGIFDRFKGDDKEKERNEQENKEDTTEEETGTDVEVDTGVEITR
jgi:hypothetical protein